MLRSRRLAILLMAVVAVWAMLASSVAGWSRSLSGGAFVAVVSLLCVATIACAWERSLQAVRWPRRLATARATEYDVPAEVAVSAVGELGLLVRPAGDAFIGHRRASALSLWASPVFHVALATGMGLAAASILLASQTGVVLVTGAPQRVTVGGVSAQVELREARPDLVVDGVDRGDAPRVLVDAGAGRRAESWVYPNRPLRVAGFTFHAVDSGPSVRLAVATGQGSTVETDVPLVSGVGPAGTFGARLTTPGGGGLLISQQPGRRIRVQVEGSAEATPGIVVGVDEDARLADGLTVRLVATSAWASLAVKRDPTLLALAVCAAIACLSSGVALLRPARLVRIERSGRRCRVCVLSARVDPAFSARVAERLRERSEKL